MQALMTAPLTWLPSLLLAPFVGSFLGTLILRLPQGRDVVWARSECDTCHSRLAPQDMVPLLSFLALRGRCRVCRSPIPRFHLWVELAAVVIAVWVVTARTNPALIWSDCILGWALLALSWIDLRHFLLPDVLTLPLVLAGLAATFWLDPSGITDAAAGATIGFLAFYLVAIGYRALRGRDGLGQGDAKLMAAAGAWVGWQGLPPVIVGAACLGIVFAVFAHLRRPRGRLGDTPIPFGPCIALALFVVRLYSV